MSDPISPQKNRSLLRIDQDYWNSQWAIGTVVVSGTLPPRKRIRDPNRLASKFLTEQDWTKVEPKAIIWSSKLQADLQGIIH
jgi:hypothetical protein